MIRSRVAASFAMALGLSFHFFGYECARAASISLLAAKEIGLGSEALSFVSAVGSPASALTLYLYSKSIKKYGPQFTFRVSGICCLLLLGLMVAISGHLSGSFGKVAVVSFYAFREIYVTLLSTQQWSFIASVLDPSTSSYLVSFSGIVSISSAVGGFAVEHLVKVCGVKGLLVTAFCSVTICYLCSEIAYFLAHGLENVPKFKEKVEVRNKAEVASKPAKGNFWWDSLLLMREHRVLQLLFVEAIFHQLVGNMLNLMFHDALRVKITEDSDRAALVGRFFAAVNVFACGLQFLVLPSILSQSTLPQILAYLPGFLFLTSALSFIFPSLISIMLAFGTMKVIEYSIMTAATEMIYMPMGSDVRYLGKELVKFFGHKLGKSGSSIFLSLVSSHFRPSLSVQSGLTFSVTGLWAVSMYVLSEYIKQRDLNLASNNVNVSPATADSGVSNEGSAKNNIVDVTTKSLSVGVIERNRSASESSNVSLGPSDTTNESEGSSSSHSSLSSLLDVVTSAQNLNGNAATNSPIIAPIADCASEKQSSSVGLYIDDENMGLNDEDCDSLCLSPPDAWMQHYSDESDYCSAIGLSVDEIIFEKLDTAKETFNKLKSTNSEAFGKLIQPASSHSFSKSLVSSLNDECQFSSDTVVATQNDMESIPSKEEVSILHKLNIRTYIPKNLQTPLVTEVVAFLSNPKGNWSSFAEISSSLSKLSAHIQSLVIPQELPAGQNHLFSIYTFYSKAFVDAIYVSHSNKRCTEDNLDTTNSSIGNGVQPQRSVTSSIPDENLDPQFEELSSEMPSQISLEYGGNDSGLRRRIKSNSLTDQEIIKAGDASLQNSMDIDSRRSVVHSKTDSQKSGAGFQRSLFFRVGSEAVSIYSLVQRFEEEVE